MTKTPKVPRPKCQAETKGRRGGTRSRCFHSAREGHETCGIHASWSPHNYFPGTPGFVPQRG